MLLQNEPEEIKYFDPIESIQQDYFYSNLFRKEQQKICSNAFQIVEERLFYSKNSLGTIRTASLN
ncbi:hypothetical protein ABGV42_05405 [Paenibacillus pabuli]